ncbi:alpha/beta fold hydrolase [Cyclobacterium marinum]|uniref:alpha/beta fold hydrolase n=2 Tax=Cyclobacterium marinum TaxID=104 RepID=UPI0011EF75A3|nr:alpha/beta hydrolase [Cyclobacterium marinum]MBI0398103.1 alpha/beta hydrolase [Cyclobacterium marinum]|tara:strand:+ start:31246 stop:32166 length:921 start_codon:yes stop_codon:yes gene_type:complete
MNTQKRGYKIFKMTLGILILVVLPIAIIAGYQYLQVVLAPPYTFEAMPSNFEILGSGEKNLVFIHGLTGSKNYWKRDLDAITNTHKILLVDLLGFGDSPKPNSDYRLEMQVGALEATISREGFDRSKTVLVAHSMGTVIALALLAKHPDWFKGAITIGTPVYKNMDEFKKIMSKHSLFDRLATNKYSKYLCLLHPIFMTRPFKPDNLSDEVFADAKKHNWQSYNNSLNEIILETDLYAIVRKIGDKKVVFIHGNQDTTAPMDNAIKLADTILNSKFLTINGGDHQLFLKDPNIVWKAVGIFFDKKS